MRHLFFRLSLRWVHTAESDMNGSGYVGQISVELYGYHKPAQRPGHLERPQVYSNNQIRLVIVATADGTTSRHGGDWGVNNPLPHPAALPEGTQYEVMMVVVCVDLITRGAPWGCYSTKGNSAQWHHHRDLASWVQETSAWRLWTMWESHYSSPALFDTQGLWGLNSRDGYRLGFFWYRC